jgi:hypothetical protein
VKIWALWSSRVDPYAGWDLIELFVLHEDAEAVRAGLIGKQADQRGGAYLWHQDPDGVELFDDLHVRSLDLR